LRWHSKASFDFLFYRQHFCQKNQNPFTCIKVIASQRRDVRFEARCRMWANAQRDDRPAEYRWRPLFNAAKFWLTPTARVSCSNAAKTRNPLKLAGVPQTNEPISAASKPKFTNDMWGIYCCLTTFFPNVDMCLSCEDIGPAHVVQCVRHSDAMCSRA